MTNGHILVVDDLPDVGWTIKGLLEDVGYWVRYMRTRTDALHALDKESFRVAVLDVRLDEYDVNNRDGIWLMHKINRNYPLIKIIIFTGYPMTDMILEALSHKQNGAVPAFAFLNKKDGFDRLAEVVKSALHPE